MMLLFVVVAVAVDVVTTTKQKLVGCYNTSSISKLLLWLQQQPEHCGRAFAFCLLLVVVVKHTRLLLVGSWVLPPL